MVDEANRRKSFIRRIADSLTSFVPISFFNAGAKMHDDEENMPSPIAAPFSDSRVMQNHRNWSGFSSAYQQPTTVVSSSTGVGNKGRESLLSHCHDVDLDACDDNMSTHSRESVNSVSTSGVSSLLPHDTVKRPKLYSVMSTPRNERILEEEPSTLLKRFHHAAESEAPGSKRMCYRSTVAESSYDNNNSFAGNNNSSMFYTGSTFYGGAASSNRLQLAESSLPLRYDVTTKRSFNNESSAASVVLSSTARRILENMEKMSSPLQRIHTIASSTGSRSYAPSCSSRGSNSTIGRSTTRYPPYMSAFQRFKRLQQQDEPLASRKSEKPPASEKAWVPPAVVEVNLSKMPAVVEPVKQASPAPPVMVEQPKTPQKQPSPAKPVVVAVETEPKKAKSVEEQPFLFSVPGKSTPEIHSASPNVRHDEDSENFKFSHPKKFSNMHQKYALQHTDHDEDNGEAFKQPEKRSLESEMFTRIAGKTNNSGKKPIVFSKITLPEQSTFNVWRCKNCLIEMPESKNCCSKCLLPKISFKVASPAQTSRWTTEEPAAPVARLVSKAKNSTWRCEACLVDNDEGDSKCSCCETPKEKAPTKVALLAPPVIWSCEVCLASNDATDEKCACCETLKPDFSKPQEAEKPKSTLGGVTFSFNQSSAPAFNFGSDAKVASTPITFGIAACNLPQPTTVSETDKPTGPKLFSFGSSSDKPVTTATTQPFQFGAASSTSAVVISAPPKLIAQFEKPAVAAPQSAFQFGSTSGITQPTTTAGYNFSLSSSGNATGVFKFGESVAKPSFNFGESNNTASQLSSNSSGGFQFGAGASTPGGNIFSASSADANVENRVVKRAVRRFKK